jgi:hypothetical protein
MPALFEIVAAAIRYWWIELTAVDAAKCGLSFRVSVERDDS